MFDPNKMNSFLGKTQCVWLYMIPCDDSMMTFFKLRTLFQVESSRRNPRRGRTHRAGVISMPFFDWQWCRSWKHEDQLLTLVKHFLTEFYFRLYNHIIYVVTYIHTNGIIRIWSWSTSTMGSRLDVAQVCLVLPDLPGDFKMMWGQLSLHQ